MLRYTADLPWNVAGDDIERLRGLGSIRFVLEIEGVDRKSVIRDLVDLNMGGDYRMGDPDWWSDRLSRGVRG